MFGIPCSVPALDLQRTPMAMAISIMMWRHRSTNNQAKGDQTSYPGTSPILCLNQDRCAMLTRPTR